MQLLKNVRSMQARLRSVFATAISAVILAGCTSYEYSEEDARRMSAEEKRRVCVKLKEKKDAICQRSSSYGNPGRSPAANSGDSFGAVMCEVDRDDAKKSWRIVGC